MDPNYGYFNSHSLSPYAERNLQIYEEHEAGASYASLAKKYELSQSRVAQIVSKVRKNLNTEGKEYPELFLYCYDKGYPVIIISRIFHALSASGYTDETWKQATREELMKCRNLGVKSVDIILKARYYGKYKVFVCNLDEYYSIGKHPFTCFDAYQVEPVDSERSMAYTKSRNITVSNRPGEIYYNQTKHSINVWYNVIEYDDVESDQIFIDQVYQTFIEYTLTHINSGFIAHPSFNKVVEQIKQQTVPL